MSFTLPDAKYAKSLLSSPQPDPPAVTSTIKTLSLLPLPEGGFFIETDRDLLLVPNPFLINTNIDDSKSTPNNPSTKTSANQANDPNTKVYNYAIASKPTESPHRNASTTIHYLITPSSPIGRFHRNKARTVHTLHWGRARYVILHPPGTVSSTGEVVQAASDKEAGKWTIETFTVGTNIAAGEKLQWIVEGGRYKASYLLPDADTKTGTDIDGIGSESGSQKGLLISETVVPGFEYTDHDFLSAEKLEGIVGVEGLGELGWLLRREGER